MIPKYILFSLWLSVFVICTFKVHVSNGQELPSKKKKEKKKKEEEVEDSTGKSFTAHGPDLDVNTSEDGIVQTLEQFLEVPPMPFITYGPYPFEGVDYDLLPEKVYKDYYDCYYWHTKCVRNKVYLHAVCAYSSRYGWTNFVNQCEIDLQNCKHRMYYSLGIFGTHMRNDLYFYNGDGWDCRYWFRRSPPDDRVNFYYEGEQKSILENEIIDNSTFRILEKAKDNSTVNVTKFGI